MANKPKCIGVDVGDSLYKEKVGAVALTLASSNDVILSPLSENYKIILTRYIRNKDWGAIATGMAVGTSEKTVTMGEDYSKVDPQALKWGGLLSDSTHPTCLEYKTIMGNETISGLGWGTLFDKDIDVYIGQSVFKMDDGITIRICNQHGNSCGTGFDYSLPFYHEDGSVKIFNANHDKCGYSSFSMIEGGKSIQFPGHPSYSYDAEEITQLNGATAPIASVMTMVLDWGKGPRVNFICPAYIGRRGEVRNSDLSATSTEVTVDGEIVFSDSENAYNLLRWLSERYNSDADMTKVEVTFTNNNFEIDGLRGCNITSIRYDEKCIDQTVPQVQMLSFKNREGIFTDHFRNPADGIMEFSAGDFDWVNGEDYQYWYTVDRPSVKVEYSPYGNMDFNDISVCEVEDLYRMPNFGHFYRANLAEVDKYSENGWFDLRFSLSDENGNSLVQTVSPAFHIESLSGISSPESDTMIYSVGKDIIAPADARIFNLEGVETGRNNLPSGVYIIVSKQDIIKMVIR